MMRAFLAKRNFASKLKKFKSQDSTATEPVGQENGKEESVNEEKEKDDIIETPNPENPDETVEVAEEGMETEETEEQNSPEGE